MSTEEILAEYLKINESFNELAIVIGHENAKVEILTAFSENMIKRCDSKINDEVLLELTNMFRLMYFLGESDHARDRKVMRKCRSDKPSEKMDEFLDKVDSLCGDYGYEFWPTIKGWNPSAAKNGEYETFACIGNGEAVKLVFLDGDGRGK